MKKLKILALILAATTVLTACSSTQPQKSEASSSGSEVSATSTVTKNARDQLVVAIANEPGSLDPQNVGVVSAYQVQEQMFNTLVERDEEGNFLPSLAESWEQIDDTTIRFKLRQDVLFHNGEKMTAEDVRYSIQRATEIPLSASIFKGFDGEATAVVDDYTVDVKTKEPFAGALSYLATTRGSIVSKKAAEEKGLDGFGLEPIGTGPFKLSKWESGDRIILEKFDDYWGDKATYKTLIARIIPDASVRSMELESGGVDFLFDTNPADYDRIKNNPNLVTEVGTSFTHELWLLSMTAEEFSDIKVRKAMSLALDIPAIVKTVWGELGVPADSVFSDKVYGHVSIGPIKQDVEEAKKLLAEAGYPNGFSTEITFGESAVTQAALEIAQQMWAAVGINVTITPLDQATYKDNNAAGITRFGRSNFTTSTGDPDHALANWQSGYKGALNANDAHIDELMAKGRAESDDAKRKEIYKELQEYCWNSYYSIPVVFSKVSYAYTNKITNFEFASTQQPNLSQIIFSE
ncbi:ABC transporter substrate-binding protein [Scatolibacter rhodanostii]|uniref:ABC transporter substrate-binding protein n=1 Tax=Scatolibacter rhodanostii TaxID=2014781 RepID=UPI000C070E5A|nr:ABC transporter substrate-binding protein [Scatolibacter rhodanostii]